jgi:hypothetical protein
MSYDYDLNAKAKEIGLDDFIGCKMQDQFTSRKPKTKEMAIVNLQNSNQSGSHWCCYYRNGNDKYYFDSYGLDPPLALQKYLGKNIQVFCTYDGKYPDKPMQQFDTKICGELCLIVLWLLNNGHSFKDTLDIINTARQ